MFLVGNETLPARVFITCAGLSIQYPSALLSFLLFNAKLLLNIFMSETKRTKRTFKSSLASKNTEL